MCAAHSLRQARQTVGEIWGFRFLVSTRAFCPSTRVPLTASSSRSPSSELSPAAKNGCCVHSTPPGNIRNPLIFHPAQQKAHPDEQRACTGNRKLPERATDANVLGGDVTPPSETSERERKICSVHGREYERETATTSPLSSDVEPVQCRRVRNLSASHESELSNTRENARSLVYVTAAISFVVFCRLAALISINRNSALRFPYTVWIPIPHCSHLALQPGTQHCITYSGRAKPGLGFQKLPPSISLMRFWLNSACQFHSKARSRPSLTCNHQPGLSLPPMSSLSVGCTNK